MNRHDGMAAAGVFALALMLRLVFLHQIESLPFLSQPVVDGLFLDTWAREIASGEWWGNEVFYQAPGYPYFLAMVYSLFGDSLWRAHQIQMGVGALSCVFMYFAASRFFDRRVGLVAALILAIYPPALFFDSLIQKAGLGLLLICIFLFLVALFQETPSVRRAFFCGIALALLGLTRENALIFLAVVPLWIGLRFSNFSRVLRLRWAASFVIGAAILLSVVGLRNYFVGETFALTSSNFGTNFYIGNHSGADGLYSPLVPGRQSPQFEGLDARLLAEAAEGRALSAGEVSQHWLSEGIGFIREEPVEWLAQIAFKSLLTVNATEVPDSQDFYAYAEASALLGCLMQWMNFGIIMPFALMGIMLAWPRGRDVWIHIFLPAAFAMSVVVFFVFARYRYPLVPLLLPVSAFGFVELVRRVQARDLSGLVAPGIVFILALAVCNIQLMNVDRLRSTSSANLGVIAMRNGELAQAEHYLERAEEYNPESADVWFQLAALRYEQQRLEDAKFYLFRLIQREEKDHRPHLMLALIFRKQGQPLMAQRHRIAAKRLAPVPLDDQNRINPKH
ncbi:MAG: glycosyltransferase family 39 protein [Myxococcota bacterium]|nr:glycosyltransferase family 39 protein [Myxococcota bacterium]